MDFEDLYKYAEKLKKHDPETIKYKLQENFNLNPFLGSWFEMKQPRAVSFVP